MYFSSYFLFLVVFLHCAFWVVHDVRLGVRKNAIFSARKNVIFLDRKNDVFSRETIGCFLAPALSLRKRIPYLSANRLEPRISRDQPIQTCQFKTTNVAIHLAVPKVYTYLISFGQMEMANASENFGHTLVRLRPWMMQSTTSTQVSETFFRASEKMLFFRATASGWRSEKIMAGWLARWLAGYLTIGFVAAWLAIRLLAIWLAG